MSKYYLSDNLNEDLAKKSECNTTLRNSHTLYAVANENETSFVDKADKNGIIVMRINPIEGLQLMKL